MRRLVLLFGTALLALTFAFPQYGKHPSHNSKSTAAPGAAPAILWRQPEDIQSRDLFYGPGGPEHVPKGKLQFIEEDLKGSQPKFFVRDSEGTRWGVKLGPEARAETAATRILWALGYFADTEYYLPELPLKGMPQLKRGEQYTRQGKAIMVRMKRYEKGVQAAGFWRWDENPFVGTRELNGLKVIMELMNNTDFKQEHLVIHEVEGREQRYMVKDLGATFGRAGAGYFNRTKGKLSDYARADLIRQSDAQYVDFWYFKQVPRADAKWAGELAGKLSDKQLNDAFHAAGFSDREVQGFVAKWKEKVNELKRL